ncbi:choice-of-anchor D domain-containing protein [Chryseobacterium suipulveris]|uniref:Choice-of-anchor D domain-containing protein n=1 Tax=Chryseobacterium suipulveris TaxID=2929800 RepID=A0ABY4BQR7_9FLAO|nr:choice-of-anchor D domain-containing protein [Chryseobacterium suipulveris]UOE41538.1 choice-of-anchor D domain-containing protein [Chryseobacterium suipulveris]
MKKIYLLRFVFSLVFAVLSIKGRGQATLPFSYDDGKGSLPTGLTQSGLGSDYSASPKLKFDTQGAALNLFFSDYPGVLSYNVKGNPGTGSATSGTFLIEESDNGINWTTLRTITNKNNTTTTFNDNPKNTTRHIRWTYSIKTSGNIALGAINLTKSSCTTPTQSFSSSSVTKTVGDPAFTNTFTTNSTGTVTYSSSNTAVATVNTTTGLVTIAGAGSANITATTAANGSFCAATLSYSLTVNTGSTPSISAIPTSLSGFTYVAGSGPSASQSFTVTGNNLSSGITVTAPANFEVSTNNSTFSNTVSLPVSGGTVYARLVSGLAVNNYSGNISLSSTGATTQNVAVSGSVTAAVCTFSETFSGIGTTASYGTRTWTGIDSTGGNTGAWTATDAREDQTINGKAITIRSGAVTSPTFNNGIASLTLKTKFPFAESSGNLVLKINGTSVGTLLYSEMDGSTVITKTFSNINIPGNIVITLESSGARYTIDDISWTCFSGSPTPVINVKGNNITIPNGSTTTSTGNNTDFGTTLISAPITKTFTIENNGSANLILDTPAVLMLDGSKGFNVSAQPATNPMTGYSNQTFTITFTKTTPGIYEDTVMIGSNASNTTVYSYKIKAQVLEPVLNVSTTALSGFTYPLSQGPSDTQNFTVNASNLSSDVTVTSTTNWEISTNLTYDGSNTSPYNSITLPKTASNTAQTNPSIHVRLKDGLPIGIYSGTITIATPGTASKTIALSGEVTAGIPSIKVTGAGSTINNGSSNPTGLNNTLFAGTNLGSSSIIKDYVIENRGALPLVINEITLTGADVSNFVLINPPAPGTTLNQFETYTFSAQFAPVSEGVKNATVTISNNDSTQNPFTFAIRGNGQYCAAVGKIILAQQGFEGATTDPLAFSTTSFGEPGPLTGLISGKSTTADRPSNNNFYAEGLQGYAVQGKDLVGEIESGLIFTFDPVSTLHYTNIELSMKIAGFSIGSTTNGIDCSNTGNTCLTNDTEKIDRFLIEVSPDGGANWYKQAAVVAGEMNVAWSFGSANGSPASIGYNESNNPQYFKAYTSGAINALSITNLPAVAALKVRITAGNNSDKEMWVIDAVKITSTGLNPNIWNGTQWSRNTVPINSDKVIIDGNYDSAVNGSFQACQCEIKSGAKLTVAAGNPVTVSDWMVNNGIVSVQNDAGFVQVKDVNSNSGTGTYEIHRDALMKRLDYTYWGSPVQSQQLKAFSPLTVATRFYTYRESTDLFETVDYNQNFIPGKGYAIRAANTNLSSTYSTTAVVHPYVFVGTVNNATISFPLSYTPVTDPMTGLHAVAGYNLVGNPYPSNINFRKFYQNNNTKIQNKAYFWTNTNPTPSTPQGSTYNGANYAALNATGGAAATNSFKIPTEYIKVGQGFMVQAKPGNNNINLVFSNSIRDNRPDHSSVFYNKGLSGTTDQLDRYWLKLTTPSGNFNTLLIGYIDGATDGIDEDYDSQVFKMGSDVFYSSVNDEKLIIQGRSYPLNTNDVVKLGAVMYETGNYTISLLNKEGVFDGTQTIYLKDKLTGIETNLSISDYVFSAEQGTSAGRFEIRYLPEAILGASDSTAKGDVEVYRDGNAFVIRSHKEEIKSVEVYDSSGRMVRSNKNKAKEIRMDAEALSNGVYILKIEQQDQQITKKVIR